MKHLKSEFDKLTFREVVIFVMSWVSLAMAYVFLFMGLLIPPEGEVHDSVLMVYSITLFFIASLLGITFHYSGETKAFKKSILDFLHGHRLTLDAGGDALRAGFPEKIPSMAGNCDAAAGTRTEKVEAGEVLGKGAAGTSAGADGICLEKGGDV